MKTALVLDLDETLVQMGPLHHVLFNILSSFPPEEVEQQMAIFNAPLSILSQMTRLHALRPAVIAFLARIARCTPEVPVILYTDAGFCPESDTPHQYDHLPYVADAITYAVNTKREMGGKKWDGFHALLTRSLWYTEPQRHGAPGHHFGFVQQHPGRVEKDLVSEVERVVFGGDEVNILFLDDRNPELVRMDPDRHMYLRVAPYKTFNSNEAECQALICLMNWKDVALPHSVRSALMLKWNDMWTGWMKERNIINDRPMQSQAGVPFPGSHEWWRFVDPWLMRHRIDVPQLSASRQAL